MREGMGRRGREAKSSREDGVRTEKRRKSARVGERKEERKEEEDGRSNGGLGKER